MFSKFFIERPIFANVIAIMTMIVGGVALYGLPIERYPNITPPTVLVTTTYPGADAKVLSDTVASPVEQEVNGVEGMLYMSSTCSSDGSYKLTVTFEVGTDLDKAQVLVQNRLAVALPRLPQEVQRQGITAKKQSTNIILAASLISPDNRYDDLYLSNYAALRVKDELSRIYGVGDVLVIGSGNYGMRIWLDPEKLKARGLTTEDVLAAIREQNVQVAAGQVGQYPSPTAPGLPVQRDDPGPAERPRGVRRHHRQGRRQPRRTGRRVRGRARPPGSRASATSPASSSGSQVYDQWCEIGGQPAATLAVFQLPGANALDVAAKVKATMERIKPSFPDGARLRHPVRHDDLRRRVDPRGLQDALRGGRPRADRDPGLPPGLAGRADPGDDRAGDDHRGVRRDGRAGLLGQHADALRPGAGHRHRRRRRDRDRRERRPPHRPRRSSTRRMPRSRRCPR